MAFSLVKRLKTLPQSGGQAILTCIYATGAGLGAVAFQLAIHALFDLGFLQLAEGDFRTFLWSSLAIVLSSSLIVGWLLTRFCPGAAGSGIPQLKASYWKDFGYMKSQVVWVKFLAGVISIAGGASLGREGPSVQLAGGIGSRLAGHAGEPKSRRRQGAATGAAAGLAAAFNTPLAAITFVLEEIIGNLNSRLLGSVLLASVVGAFCVHAIVGPQPAFTLAIGDSPSWLGYVLTPIVGAVAALFGVAFQSSSLWVRGKWKMSRVPQWMGPAIGGLITWGLGVTVFYHTGKLGVFGLGYEDLSAALAFDLSWKIALLLLFTKWIATVACYGFGGCGGIFSPTLFFGAMVGTVFAGGLMEWFPLTRGDQEALAIVGMTATLGAVVRAPVTGILIVFEMTHDFSMVPALMLGALTSQAVSRQLLKHGFYEALLDQDGHDLEHFNDPRDLRSWQRQPVGKLANSRPIVINSLDPKDLEMTMKSHPYDRFPVVIDDVIQGIIARTEVKAALREERKPNLEPAPVCDPSASLNEVQMLLIESPTGMVIMRKPGELSLAGILTLHDLLRAQQSAADAPADA